MDPCVRWLARRTRYNPKIHYAERVERTAYGPENAEAGSIDPDAEHVDHMELSARRERDDEDDDERVTPKDIYNLLVPRTSIKPNV